MVKKYYKRTYQRAPGPRPVEWNESATYLIVVESPSKCKKIESYLGSHYCCIASKGHIRNIKGLSSIDSSMDYHTTYSILDDKKSHVEWMRTVISRFDKRHIYLATDDDREGEAIAWHICDVFGLPLETTHRIKFHEVTEPAIKRALAAPTVIDMNRVNAQKARQILDMMVGYKISPMLWKYIFRDKNNVLSAGRCQTPALRLVYENAEEIRRMAVEKHYQVRGSFYLRKIDFILNRQMETEEQVTAFLEASKTHVHAVTIKEKRETAKPPPKPFHTSLLLQFASTHLHMNPKETMSLCQELYQEGHITYMRTESQQYSCVFLEEAKTFIRRTYDQEVGEDLENRDAGNPHEAIRVTHLEVESVKLENPRANTLYKWIRKNTLESCMLTARYNYIPVTLSAPMGYHYTHTIEIPLFLGWKKVDTSTPCDNHLLYIQSSSQERVPYNRIAGEISIHGKHSHYTEASLIHRLEKMGIGRPSTFASIVETILDRGYVEKKDIVGEKFHMNEFSLVDNEIEIKAVEKYIGNEKGKLVIAPIGTIVSDFLKDHYDTLFEYEYTRKMEDRLDGISRGRGPPWHTLCRDCEKEIDATGSLVKRSYPLKDTSEYEIVYEKYGFALRTTTLGDTRKCKYENIRTDIDVDIERIKSGDYTLEELINVSPTCIHVGDRDVLLKTGPYGRYLQSDSDEKTSFKTLNLDEYETDESVISKAYQDHMTKEMKENKNIIRKLTENLSIRNGKYGAYIYYQTLDMKKPQFYNLNSFKESYRYCNERRLLDWIKEKYNI
jgi:DNA topoisomerase-1|uniref:DNA topoisomerase n=1 Tax=viral metagenome TaxID=1070528 RepID=A0A6C0DYN6_9ZZZZ